MNKYINTLNSKYILIGIFILFNLLFVLPRLAVMSFPPDELVVDYRTLQYFFSYNLEFMKRGLIGTLFDIFNIQPTLKTIWILSLLFSNIVFFLIYNYLKIVFKDLQNSSTWIIVFLFLFTISPATVWNFGYEAGRADLLNLAIELLIVIIIICNNNKFHFMIPILLGLGMLSHEAFLFMSIPIIIALLFDRFTRNRAYIPTIISSFIVIFCVVLAIIMYGKINSLNFESLYMSAYQKPLPGNLPTINTFMIVTSSLSTNILFTLREYFTLHVWKSLILALPLLASYLYLYVKPVKFLSLPVEKKVLFLSPFLIFPLFLLGVDIYRWFSMMLINMFIVSTYFIYTKMITFSDYKTKGIKIALYIIIFYSSLGALGARVSFPYVFMFLDRVL
jgi:hypothetical protein